MANQVDIAQTIVNQFAVFLENELVAAKAVSSKKYDNELDAENGLQTRERVPPRYNVVTTSNGVANLTSGTQETIVGSEIVEINQTKNTSFGYGDFERIKSFSDAVESQALKAAASALAHNIDGEILSVAAKAAYNWVGTPGEPVKNLYEFMEGYTRLKEEGVEDTDLFAVLSYADKQNLQKYIAELPSSPSLSTPAFSRGKVGMIGDIPVMFTQQLPTLVSGARVQNTATLGVDGSHTTFSANYRDVARSTAQGYHNTFEFVIDNLSTNDVAVGDVFTIGSDASATAMHVPAYDNRLGASLARSQQFVIVAKGTLAAGEVVVRVAPAPIVPGSGAGADQAINTAHGTVVSAPDENNILQFATPASAAVKPRIMLQKDAILLSTAKLVTPNDGKFRMQTLQDVPISVRMWWDSDFGTGAHRVRFDAAVQANVMDRRRIVRLNGVAA